MILTASISTTQQLLEQDNLSIPPYQRPYRWTTTNVMQLLDDISASMAARKRKYRIGTVICHDRGGICDIVDGQQRLTTMLLLLNEMGKADKEVLRRFRFTGTSIAALLENREFIKNWLKTNMPGNTSEFAGYVLNKCEFVKIVVDDLGEAFQMFDTQNGRGKSLELYNLLKAYHIRAMEQNSQEERVRCDRNWEGATQYDATPDINNDPNIDILKQLFNEQLFKSRVWCRNENARSFCKNDIGEFKGFTIDKNNPISFPFQNPFLLQYLTEKFYNNVLAGTMGTKSRFEEGETNKINPFVNINQTIINGKAFFEYVETYVELYKKMFIELGNFQLSEFKRFFYLYCLTYTGDNEDAWEKARIHTDVFRRISDRASRVGDSYLRETYKSICFVLLDKFGENVFCEYYEVLYRLIYKVRIQNYAVKISTAMSAPTRLFAIIHRAKSEADLLPLNKFAYALKDMGFSNSDKLPTKIGKFIKEGFYHE